MPVFTDDVVAAVTKHMNIDHPEDNLLIARAFGRPGATASEMIGVTGEAGVWNVVDSSGSHELSVPWPGGAIAERPEIRREVVALYKASCERLGVEPREEHGSSQKGAHAMPEATDAEQPFSKVLREGTWSDHGDSEHATFMEDIMRGEGTRQDYIDLVAQHYFMYEALEAASERVADDPAFVGFHPPALERLRVLEADLTYLIGDDWRERIAPVPATAEYAARMREVGEQGWVAGVVAHHYTRYLGDLSGGQFIAKRVARQHGFEKEGIAFYDFTELGSPSRFKERYRDELDRLGEQLGEEERARMLDEVRKAYHFNTAVFLDLGRAKELAGA